jgi:hypothetical protein
VNSSSIHKTVFCPIFHIFIKITKIRFKCYAMRRLENAAKIRKKIHENPAKMQKFKVKSPENPTKLNWLNLLKIRENVSKSEIFRCTSCWGTSWPKSSRTLTRLLFLDTPEHVDSKNLIKQICFGRSAYQLFPKCDLNS